MEVPKSHPRYGSLKQRSLLVDGIKEGYVAEAGLIAHGRGEAFDYLLEEKTLPEAECAEKAATALLLLSDNPVISVNGNVAALTPAGVVELAEGLDAKLEVNLFHRTAERERLIEEILLDNGAGEVYGVGVRASERVPGLDSLRGAVDSEGIYKADAVLVLLEDGDRTEALVSTGKKVVAVDLNPLSRTAQKANVSIIDNISRAIPNMTRFTEEFSGRDRGVLEGLVEGFNNKAGLEKTIKRLRVDI